MNIEKVHMKFNMEVKRSLYHRIASDFRANPLVTKIIPVLIQWAKDGKSDGTYGELNKLIGYENGFSGIGMYLGCIQDIIDIINLNTKLDIPTLNCLVANKRTMLPSYGFEYVDESYGDMTEEEQRVFVDNLKLDAFEYPYWDEVLEIMHLKK